MAMSAGVSSEPSSSSERSGEVDELRSVVAPVLWWRLDASVVALCGCELGARVAGVLSLLALSWGRFEMALWLAAAVNLLAALRGLVGGHATERALRSTWDRVVQATRHRSLYALRSRDESQQLAALTEASGHVAHFHAAVYPRALSHALGLCLTALAVIFWLGPHWVLLGFGVVLALTPLVLFGYRRLARKRQLSFECFVDASADLGLLLEGASELRAHGVEARHCEQLHASVAAMAGAERRSYVVRSWLNAMPLAIAFVAVLFPLRRFLPEFMSEAGGIAEFGILAGAGVTSLIGVVGALQGWAQARPFIRSLSRFFAAPAEALAGGRERIDTTGIEVVFDRVSVFHGDNAEATPHEFSCRWAPGRGLALTGDNGAGKSTLAWCLLGLRAPCSGRLSFGEVDSGDVDWARLRAKVVFVPQHGFVAPEQTIGWHLRLLSLGELSDDEIEGALHDVQLNKTLGCEGPLRDAILGDLSGGERKRVQLARALLGGPELVVLDEPEAGLDAHSRAWLQTFVQGLSEQCRVLLIAHDESVIPSSFERAGCARIK